MAFSRPMFRRGRSSLIALATVAAALAAAPRAQATAYNFDGYFGAAHTEWSYSNFLGITNWTGNALPVSAFSTDIYFGAAGKTDNLASRMDYAAFRVRSLNFRTTGSVRFSGNAIAIAGGGSVNAGSGNDYSMSNALTLNADASSTNAVSFGIDGTLTATGDISGGGALFKSGAGTLVLNGANTYSGGTTIESGILSVIGFGSLGSGNVSIASGANLTITQNGSIYAGAISGAGSLNWQSNSQIFLEGGNSYTGGTTVGGGEFIVAHPTGNYLVQKAGKLELFDPNDPYNNVTLSGSVSGEGSLGIFGRGTTTLSGTSSHTGGTFVNFGTTVASGVNALGNGPVAVESGAVLELRANNRATALTGTGSVLLTGTGVLTLSTATDTTLAASLSGTGGLTKQGAGTLTFSGGSASYTGTTTIQTGKLRVVGNGFGSGSVVAQAGTTFQFDGAASGFLKTNVSGAGDFLKTGTGRLLLEGSLTNAGSIRLNQGAIVDIAPGTVNGIAIAAGSRFENDSQGLLEFTRGVVTQGEFVTTGGSTTFFDALVSGAGGFSGFGAVEFDGGYNPGNSPASVTFQGDMALGSANVLTMELGGATLGAGYDHLNVLGAASLGGKLNVAWYGGFSASLGQTFDLFDFSSSNGAFTSISLPTLGDGLAWNTSALYTTGTIRVQSVPEPASLAALGLGALALLRRRKR